MKATIATLILLTALSTPALADETYGIDRSAYAVVQKQVHHVRRSYDASGNVIGGAPEGCPRTAFCGCALALRVFGTHVRTLWPARAWFKYPRTYAHSGAVAVTSRHVSQLISHVEGTRWLAYDPNSGGHKTRIHERDIRGTTLVDPSGVRKAEM